MSNIVRHNSEGVLGRLPSPALWNGDLAKLQDDHRAGKCLLVWDDFGVAPGLDNTSLANTGPYVSYCDVGVEIKGVQSAPNLSEALGELQVSGNDADNDEGHLQIGSGNPFRIDNAAGNTGAVYCEWRFKTASIADNGCAVFFGLGTGPVAADYMVDDTGALKADKGFIGFRTLAADGDVLEFVFQAASQTVNTVLDAHTLVADDYVKVGFRYQPHAVDANKKIAIFVNGSELATGVSLADIDAATFPEGEALVPMLLSKVGTAAEVLVTADWVAAAQYQDSGASN
jgi:hypothetical protein